jgi:hypothetical protein
MSRSGVSILLCLVLVSACSEFPEFSVPATQDAGEDAVVPDASVDVQETSPDIADISPGEPDVEGDDTSLDLASDTPSDASEDGGEADTPPDTDAGGEFDEEWPSILFEGPWLIGTEVSPNRASWVLFVGENLGPDDLTGSFLTIGVHQLTDRAPFFFCEGTGTFRVELRERAFQMTLRCGEQSSQYFSIRAAPVLSVPVEFSEDALWGLPLEVTPRRGISFEAAGIVYRPGFCEPDLSFCPIPF